MSSAERNGSTWAYRKLRARVLAANKVRNGGRCTLAIPGVCTVWATQAHHTLGWHVTGDDPRHMEATCAQCNNKVGDPRKAARGPEPNKGSKW